MKGHAFFQVEVIFNNEYILIAGFFIRSTWSTLTIYVSKAALGKKNSSLFKCVMKLIVLF